LSDVAGGNVVPVSMGVINEAPVKPTAGVAVDQRTVHSWVRARPIPIHAEPEERTMPHVIVKLHAGRSEQQKARIANEVTKAIMASVGCGEDSVSISIEEVEPAEWAENVYRPDILGNAGRLYKKPGYNPIGIE
jgi:4-oxalocrotonate tautomerase